jgi:3-dehydroquinate synthase II
MSEKGKTVWVRSDHLDSYEERKKIVSTALESGYSTIMIRAEDKELKRLGRFEAIEVEGGDLFLEGERIGAIVSIDRPEDLAKASALKGKMANVLIAANDWKIIPLENLIAEFQRSKTRILAGAATPDEAMVFSKTLEVGVDGIVIEPKDASEIKDFKDLTTGERPKIGLSAVKVTRISPVNVGDRVCLDTCSLLRIGEGMLVGSQSNCLFLIQSEAMESEYVAARPFRVNAGAVHAYVLTSDGKTKYLSEVNSGEEVMAVDTEGNSRSVVIGRSKIEVRPLLLVEVEAEGKRFTTILQNAETIRLCTPTGAVSISELKIGQEVFVRLEQGGRHFGHAIKETIREK